jgi:UV DNA damage endonuclease
MVRYGYACINITLQEQGIYIGRTAQRKAFLDKGIQHCSKLSLQNIQDLSSILKWNIDNKIQVYRMSSDMFPWVSEYRYKDMPDYTEIRNLLEHCGDIVKQNNLRLSFHPGPFNCLASEDASVVAKTIAELDKHSEVMDMLGLPESHMAKINIHVGGAYGNKPAALGRFAKNFRKLSSSTRSRLTVENDDRASMFGVLDLYGLYRVIGTPIVFDGHHFEVGVKNNLSYEEAYNISYSTWNCTPTFHWSNSAKIHESKDTGLTTHSDWYYSKMLIPDTRDIDIILESKMKEQALLKYLLM